MKKTILSAIFALAIAFTATAQNRITNNNLHRLLPIEAIGEIKDLENVERVHDLNMYVLVEQNETHIILTIISDGEQKEPTYFSRDVYYLFETTNGDILLIYNKKIGIAFMNQSFGWVILYND